MVTRNEVARRAGVSVAVVSYVLNNKSIVKEETRKKVLEAVEELGYLPNLTARSLKTKKSNQLAVLTNFIGNPFEAGILLHLEEAARRSGYMVTYRSYHPDREHELKTLLAGRVDGIVLLGQSLEAGTVEFFEKRKVPLVSVMASSLPQETVVAVDVDWEAGYREVIGELCHLGHRHIAYIGHGNPSDPLHPRRMAFDRALRSEERFQAIRCDFLEGGGRYESAREAVMALPGEPIFTALVCVNDLTAIGAVSACRERGWSVPGRLSIIGSENILMVSETHPPIAALEYPRVEAAYAAIEKLVGMMGGEPRTGERLPMSFVRRASLAKAPGRSSPG
ncbi:LacI family DNA-binding transcriptional regulator [Gorillibacterium sp. sgz5001074]|uniref:LacI family DNA-binding transcriptional regulator n=1 Tax=Gorillibacterium sp. sgz5001074 TaxID=3446695 RepID=UPI003F679F94